ncbi:cytochrome P450 [Xylariaceae sp. FL0804]|nr:cytochrome P450 [Xylariaceae sp. FL0804]
MSDTMLGYHQQLFLAVASGVLAHRTYFVHGERDLEAANIARLHILVSAALLYAKWTLEGLEFRQALLENIAIGSAYAVGVFGSTTVFRLFISPLKHVPGPLRLRISKLAHVWDIVKVPNFQLLHDLRHEYGDIVRTGPSEVTVFGKDAFFKVHGTESTCRRAAYYDILHPMMSIDSTRDPTLHAQRRKVWDRAFSKKSLEQSEDLVYEVADRLIHKLRELDTRPADISTWLEYFTFDLTGLFGLNIDFKNLIQGEHPILSLYRIAHEKLGPLGAAPWVKHLLMGIPYIERMRQYRMFMDWARSELYKSIKSQAQKPDRSNVIDHVIDDATSRGGVEANWNFVLGDFVLVIVAGSDPIRQVLTNMIYHFIRQPEHLARVRNELESINIRDYKAVQKMQHLNACIYETLRLSPAVPSHGLRVPPKGGIVLNGVYIPENTTIVTPQYSLFRDDKRFVKPDEWLPQRFSTHPELLLDKEAFAPWSIGKMSCAGKNLSLMEIRVAAALLVTEFDFEFAPGEDGSKMFSEATDFFTTTPGPLHLVIKSRHR